MRPRPRPRDAEVRTKSERAADNAAHVKEAVQRALSLAEARKLLREEGFAFHSRVVRAAWNVREQAEPGSLFDQM